MYQLNKFLIAHVHVCISQAALVTNVHVLYAMCVLLLTHVGTSYWRGYWCECAGSWRVFEDEAFASFA